MHGRGYQGGLLELSFNTLTLTQCPVLTGETNRPSKLLTSYRRWEEDLTGLENNQRRKV